jgi:hypothetical protein
VIGVLVAAWVIVAAFAPHRRSSSGEPDTAEVAEGLSGGRPFDGKLVTSVSCRQPSAGHWSCAVHFADGSRGTVQAVWYGGARTLGLSLAPTSASGGSRS